jgi:parallel beta-helix repeat protein
MTAASTRSSHAQTTPPPVPTPAPKVILVDDDRRQFREAPFSYINNAIYAAKAGDVIRVAPGIYREAIVINKPVRIEGAQFGRPATERKRLAGFLPGQESILVLGTNLRVLNPLPYTVVTVAADGAVLDGFTIQGFTQAEVPSGPRVGIGSGPQMGVDKVEVPAASNFSLLNSRIENVSIGALFRHQTNFLIEGNAFLNNQDYTSFTSDVPSLPGYGIRSDRTLDVSILSNLFSGNQSAGISLGKEVPPPAEGEEPEPEDRVITTDITSNRFDASLTAQSSGASIVLRNATGTTLTKNVISGGSEFGIDLDMDDDLQTPRPTLISQNSISGVIGHGLVVSNSLLRGRVERNTLSGNSGHGVVLSEISGFINAFNLFSRNKVTNNGGAGFLLYFAIGNNLESNTISGNGDGIVVDWSQDNQFRNNKIHSSVRNGIAVNAFASGNVFSRNRIQASGSGFFDITDASIGDETYGTRNVYRGNQATTANPPGLGTKSK